MSKNYTHTHAKTWLHCWRIVAAGLLALALLLAQMQTWSGLTSSNGQVLSYATSMSRLALLEQTNTARASADMSLLSENEKLDQSAQAKAEAMVKTNYWSHTSPDGTQPWQYFEKANYSYLRAGENLAYGFSSADQVVSAWLDSPTHRDNVLGAYQDVGFGIANGKNYQGGKFTVVVAHYGEPAAATAASPRTSTHPPVTLGVSQNVSNLSQILNGNLSNILTISLSLALGASLMYLGTHRRLLKHTLVSGEQFALHHPAIDGGLLVTVISLILLSTTGSIS